jgi:hypothetical protein
MSEELDRKIAELVMGEPEPDALPVEEHKEEWEEDLFPRYSKGGNWWCHDRADWTPFAFSTDLDLAMRAVEKVRNGENLGLTSLPDGAWKAGGLGCPWAMSGLTAPEAICRLLLALVEEK